MPHPSRKSVAFPLQPVALHKGRGANSWIAPRFAQDERTAFDDGWSDAVASSAELDEASMALRTQLEWEQCKSALSRHDSPDLPFHWGLNPYRGCEHGCIYCYARPTHSYLGYSPGLDFETRLIAKGNLPEVLHAELAKASHRASPIMLGSVTDCYQPIEREVGLTRRVIEVLAQAQHPFSIVTKGSGVERDIDLLAPLTQRKLVAVYVTLTTLQPGLARAMEPRAAAPHRRLRMIQTLREAGIPVGVSLAPQIPFLNDDMEQVLAAAADAGACQAFYAVLRLPWEVAPLFEQWLQQHFPDRAARVLERVRDLHGINAEQRAEGRVYNSQFGQRMKGQGAWADMLAQRFQLACRKLGLNRERVALDCSRYHPLLLSGQQSLF